MHRTVDIFYKENYALIYKMTSSHKLTQEQVIDAYSDSIVAFVNNIRENRFRGESKCTTYFMGIFNFKCIDIIRRETTNKLNESIISLDDMKNEPTQILTDEQNFPDLNSYFNELSEVCKEVLMDWSDGYSMDEIAERNGLKNAHTARSKRYNCFQQLIEVLKKKNILQSNPNSFYSGSKDRIY